MIPGSANPLLLASAVQAGAYSISRSVRLNSADSAYLSRTPASAGNRKTWTWAGWVKRSNVLARGVFYGNVDATANDGAWWLFENDDRLHIEDFGGGAYVRYMSSGVFRDTSAWMHLCIACDTTQATEADRLKVYINEVAHPALGTSALPPLNYDMAINTTRTLGLGRAGLYAALTFPGYLADIHFIDGQALDPTSFGEFDTNGIWQPKAYTGTYGTNGFHLAFSDNSTAASLGDDSSGNGNNWTVNNISVASGAGNDSLVDVPTNGTETDTGLGGEVRGNYCTWNPLALKGNTVLSNGNLDVDSSLTGHGHCGGTIAVTSGKWYWEITKNTNTVSTAIGLGGAQASLVPNPTSTYIGNAAGKNYIYLQSNTVYMYDGTNTSFPASSSIANDSGTFMFALDMDNAKFWVGKDGTWFQYGALSGGDPGTGSNPVFTQITSGVPYLPIVNSYTNGNSLTANFGQRPFAYTAPSGYKALCTANLPSTTITTSGIYTGNGVADGPFVYLNGVPTAMTVNGNAVTFGTHADKLSNGFKIRTTSTTFNQNASIYNYSITTTGDPFKTARAQSN